jgi:hypothetical protein
MLADACDAAVIFNFNDAVGEAHATAIEGAFFRVHVVDDHGAAEG